ncbi:hypothetical protein [Aliamphritea spongicola]|nr:hypothetical protein [Aliamphritea spongicola]
MNNFIRACVFTLMSSLAAMSWAEPLNYAMLADVTQSPESMDGEFTQTKFLAVLQVGLSHPDVSVISGTNRLPG